MDKIRTLFEALVGRVWVSRDAGFKMQRITLESGVSRKLFDAAEQAVVCDERGRVIGLFSPMLDRPQIEELQLEPTLSIEETEKLRKNRNGKPLEEILHRLGY